MKLIKHIVAGVMLSLATLIASVADAGSPALIPAPQTMVAGTGTFALKPSTSIRANAASEATANSLAERLRQATGFTFKVKSLTGTNVPKGDILLTTANANTNLGAEGYEMTVTGNGVVLRAPEQAGLFYGVQTFLQLLPPEVFSTSPSKLVDWAVPCVRIEDQPRFAWRGLLLDVSRHFLTVDEVKQFIDVMALHKLNVLHFHLTDDQGWRLEIKKYPRLTELGSVRKESPKPGNREQGDGTPYGPFFYTQDQIRGLVAYAQARHITIVPEIEMPGHLLGVLTAYPEYSCTGGPFEMRTRWGIEKDVLCMGNEKSLAFMKDILTEVLELFPSQFIHIGGDEVPRDRWKECPKCQALMKAEGLTREAQLQTWFNHRIETFLADKGRRMIGWDEILEGGLTPGAAVMSWRGTKGGLEAAEAGHDVVMAPNTHVYFNEDQAIDPDEPSDRIGRVIPLERVYAYEPVPPQLGADKRQHILGTEGCLWAETLKSVKEVEYNAYPRAAALAEVAWSPAALRNYDDFSLRLREHEKRLAALNVTFRRESYTRIGGWTPAQITTNGVTLEWDVPRFVTGPGSVIARLDYVKGNASIRTAWVAVLLDGKEVGRDTHAGYASWKEAKSTYAIAVPASTRGARYTLRAYVTGTGGTDSTGSVQLKYKSTKLAP